MLLNDKLSSESLSVVLHVKIGRVFLKGEMKRPTKSDASEPKGKMKKRAGESSATTLSKKLRDQKDGEKSKQGVQPRRDSCRWRY